MRDEQLSRWMSARRGRIAAEPEPILDGFEVLGRDPLTGLRPLSDLELRLAKSEYDGALLLVDLADFTRLNDQRGRMVGDICLKWTAQRLAELILPDDLVVRAGSDEFAIYVAVAGTAPSLFNRIEAIGQETLELLGRHEVKEAVPKRRSSTEISAEPLHRFSLRVDVVLLDPIPKVGAVEAAYEALESLPR